MRPIFKEERVLLFDNFGIEIPDNCWYDKSRVFQFDLNLKRRVLGQLVTTTPYVITYKQAKGRMPYNENEVIDHKGYLLNVSNYRELLNLCVSRLRRYLSDNPDHTTIVMNSTGKDSTVAEYIVSLCTDNYINAFNNTSLEAGATTKMAKKLKNVKIINPEVGFYVWIKKPNEIIPSRNVRKCCDMFKEGQIATQTDNNEYVSFVTGIRSDESRTRKDYEFSRKSTKWNKLQKEHWTLVNAILEFKDIDIWACILLEGLEFNELYKYGYNRVGCIVACPNQQSYYTVLDNILFSKGRKRWEKIVTDKFIAMDGWNIFNCTIEEYIWDLWKLGIKKRDEPTEEVVREFMKYKGIEDYKLAGTYFVNNCVNKCVAKRSRQDKPKVLRVYEVALNLKLRGRGLKPDQFLCEQCLANLFDMTVKELKQKVNEYKQDGCSLF